MAKQINPTKSQLFIPNFLTAFYIIFSTNLRLRINCLAKMNIINQNPLCMIQIFIIYIETSFVYSTNIAG